MSETLLTLIFSGIGVGFVGCAIALRLIYTNLKESTTRQIAILQSQLSKAQAEIHELRQFERETLIGLLVESNTNISECHRASKRATRIIEILRQRFGNTVLEAVQNAKDQADIEMASTSTHHRRDGG
jgi:Tfp pilus assembly protein PilN